MQADYIKIIVQKIEELPYKAILFDGPWGIGKSYAINEALDTEENVCKMSMFGVQDAKQIYHEVLLQFILRNSKAGKIGEIATNIVNSISTVWDKVGQAKDIINSLTKEKELFLLLSKEFCSTHIIVIDDLERISSSVGLEEVFGIVDELKHCNYVKVILISNMNEMEERNKEVFEKYNEKVIDRIYYITEKPKDVNWAKLHIHDGFITEFLSMHQVKNLRTLQKAQNFFDDVKLYCNNIKNNEFLDEIRLICYAIVVESIENLYYESIDEHEQDEFKKIYSNINNQLEHRILKYLLYIKSSKNLVTMLFQYYRNEVSLNRDNIKKEYDIFKQAGNKPSYYKSDEEIKGWLSILYDKINKTGELSELNELTDEYVVYGDIVGVDTDIILEIYKNKIRNTLLNAAMDEDENVLDYSSELWYRNSDKIKKAYKEECEKVKRLMIEQMVNYLVNETKGEKAYEYSRKLRRYLDIAYYKEIIKEYSVLLYNKNSCPLDISEQKQYRVCYNLMRILYVCDKNRFIEYCDELKMECDNMSCHRINALIEEIQKSQENQ